MDFDYPDTDPRTCLDAILFVLARLPADPSNSHFGVLAAGPLENLLVKHGGAFLDEIDVLARRDPAFRLLLNGVWLSDASPEVVTRLAKYRTAPW